MLPKNLRTFRNHDFHVYNKPAWCDQCEEFMWSLMKHSGFRCKICKYMCHDKCIPVCKFECPGSGSKKNNHTEEKGSFGSRANKIGSSELFSKASPIVSMSDARTFIVQPMYNVLLDTLAKVPKDVLKKQFELSFSLNDNSGYESSKTDSNSTSPSNCASVVSGGANCWHPKVSFISNRNVHMELILEFNKIADGLVFDMCADGTTFSGIINVYMRFKGPVNVENDGFLTLKKALRNNDSKQRMQSARLRTTAVQTFVIPSNTAAIVNVKSTSTPDQIVEKILKKYKIMCDPRKYGLFLETRAKSLPIPTDDSRMIAGSGVSSNSKKTNEPNNNNSSNDKSTDEPNHIIVDEYLFKPEDFPLISILKWGPADSTHCIFIKENDCADDMWALFAIPELNNFIRILDNEEAEFINRINLKFENYKQALEQIISSA